MLHSSFARTLCILGLLCISALRVHSDSIYTDGRWIDQEYGHFHQVSNESIVNITMEQSGVTFDVSSELVDGYLDMASARAYGVLSATGIFNSGNTTISGDIGVQNGTSSLDGIELDGNAIVEGDNNTQALNDVAAMRDTAAALDCNYTWDGLDANMASRHYAPGVHCFAPPNVWITGGDVYLDGNGDPNAYWVFRIDGDLSVGSPAHAQQVHLFNGGSACNIFWFVGANVTIHSGSVFKGTIIAGVEITLGENVHVLGGLISLGGSVNLWNDHIDNSLCGDASESHNISFSIWDAEIIPLPLMNDSVVLTWNDGVGGFEILADFGSPSMIVITTPELNDEQMTMVNSSASVQVWYMPPFQMAPHTPIMEACELTDNHTLQFVSTHGHGTYYFVCVTDSGDDDCQPGTYSSTGFAPCTQCPNNTYANIRETSCTPCPANTHAPVGADSLADCVCDDGYTSLWASGGPCYPYNGTDSYEYCERGTFSATGYQPCELCPNNTYANMCGTECHPCPDNSHSPLGAASLTECVCDEGYSSPWATGGPCHANNDTVPPDTGEGNTTEVDCSTLASADECNDHESCHSLYGHTCANDHWSFISCMNKTDTDSCDSEQFNSTCASNGDGERAWFATRCIPDGWSVAPVDGKCGSCCKPVNHPDNNGTDGDIDGCSFVNNSACVLLEYAGECPTTDLLNEWRIKVIEAVALAVSRAENISKADATLAVTISALPQNNTGTKSCAVRLQIFPPSSGDLTANDFMEAIWQQFNAGDPLEADSLTLSGVAGYQTFGSLEPVQEAESGSAIIVDPSSSSGLVWPFFSSTGSIIGPDNSAMSSTSFSFTTIGIITIIAMMMTKLNQ